MNTTPPTIPEARDTIPTIPEDAEALWLAELEAMAEDREPGGAWIETHCW